FKAHGGSIVMGTITTDTLATGDIIANPQTDWALAVATHFHSVNTNTGADTWQEAIYLNCVLEAFSIGFQQTHPAGGSLSVGGVQGIPGFGIVGDQLEEMLISGVPTAAELNSLINMVNATYGLTFPRFAKQVLFIGDSITTGAVATTGSWASLIATSDT